MKLKALVLMSAFLAMGFLAKAGAVDMRTTCPTFDLGIARSDYAIAHSSVAISSQTCTTFQPSGSYNAIRIDNLNFGTTMFYRMDGSSAAVTTVGIPILPNTSEIIETANDVNVTIVAGLTNKDARITRINK